MFIANTNTLPTPLPHSLLRTTQVEARAVVAGSFTGTAVEQPKPRKLDVWNIDLQLTVWVVQVLRILHHFLPVGPGAGAEAKGRRLHVRHRVHRVQGIFGLLPREPLLRPKVRPSSFLVPKPNIALLQLDP